MLGLGRKVSPYVMKRLKIFTTCDHKYRIMKDHMTYCNSLVMFHAQTNLNCNKEDVEFRQQMFFTGREELKKVQETYSCMRKNQL